MLNIHLITIGKLKEKHYIAACEEYVKRLEGFCKFHITELPEERLPESPSQAQIDNALEKEGERIRSRLPEGAKIIALCVEGILLSSEDLADRMEKWMVGGTSCLVFLIGGSFGLSPSVKIHSDLQMSMSKMTFPHHLARVMVLEQIYRGFQIQMGSKYHK